MSEDRIYFNSDSAVEAVIKRAYHLSSAQGLGIIHYRPGPLEYHEVQTIMDLSRGGPICMDYVHGRAVKLTIHLDRERGRHYLVDHGTWCDHDVAQWEDIKHLARTGA